MVWEMIRFWIIVVSIGLRKGRGRFAENVGCRIGKLNGLLEIRRKETEEKYLEFSFVGYWRRFFIYVNIFNWFIDLRGKFDEFCFIG